MSDRHDQDNYHFMDVPDVITGEVSFDNDDIESMIVRTNYDFMDEGDSNDPEYLDQQLTTHHPMDDNDLYLDSDPGLFGADGETGTPNATDYLPEDGETEAMEEDGEDGEDGDRLLEEGEREKQAVRIYRSSHPDIEQQQQGGREIDEHEAIWKVSTFRPDWGVEKMRDDNPLTYWQSDCPNPRSPHTVDLYFHQATFIKQVSIFIDFFQDESYSPKEISIRGGTTYRDLHEIASFECDETVGWKNVDLSSFMNEPLRVFQLQIAVLSTHLNGRDVHIRQIKVYSIPLPYLKEKNETDGEFKVRTIFHKGLR